MQTHLYVNKIIDIVKQFRQLILGVDRVEVTSGVRVVSYVLKSVLNVACMVRFVQKVPDET